MNTEELKCYLLVPLQKLFREKMGPWQVGDHYLFSGEEFLIKDEGHLCVLNGWYFLNKDYLRLPLPIDRDNPERGLWGMVDGQWGKSIHEYKGEYRFSNGKVHGQGDTPTLALLKALAAQEGIEI